MHRIAKLAPVVTSEADQSGNVTTVLSWPSMAHRIESLTHPLKFPSKFSLLDHSYLFPLREGDDQVESCEPIVWVRGALKRAPPKADASASPRLPGPKAPQPSPRHPPIGEADDRLEGMG